MMGKWISIFCFLFCFIGTFSQTNNPFDVFRNSDPVDSFSVISEKTEDITKIEGTNPFDISHLPIRKNQYKEIEELARRDDSNKETISISYRPLWSLVFSMCVLAFIIFIKKDHIVSLTKSLFNENYLRLMDYESNGGKNQIYILGYLLFLINLVLFIELQLIRSFDFNSNYLYLKLLAACTVFFLGKHVVLYIIAWIFGVEKERKVYDFKLISDYNILGIIFLIMNILIIFGPSVWLKAIGLIGFGVFGIFVIQRYYRGLRIIKYYVSKDFFHFFIYFCAFEFSPWVIVYRLVKDLF